MRCVGMQAVQDTLAVPEWSRFKRVLTRIFNDVKRSVKGGQPADYIPILAEADPKLFSMSVCTVDGQRFDLGDFESEFSMQCVHTVPLPTFMLACWLHWPPTLTPAAVLQQVLRQALCVRPGHRDKRACQGPGICWERAVWACLQ